MYTLLRYLGVVAAVVLTIKLFPGISIEGGWETILLVALVWSVITIVIKPALRILTLPIDILTLGLFGLFVHVALFYAMTFIVPGFRIDGFWTALGGACVLSILVMLIQKVINGYKKAAAPSS